MSAVDTGREAVERRIAHHEETAEAWRDIGLPGAGNALDAAMYRALLAERDAARREVGQMQEGMMTVEKIARGCMQEVHDLRIALGLNAEHVLVARSIANQAALGAAGEKQDG